MRIREIGLVLVLVSKAFVANADTPSMTNGCAVGGAPGQQLPPQQQPAQMDCRPFNQQGTTCQQVGFAEGQYGAPWGQQSGYFVCVDRCLHWAGWGANR